jgi:acetolactate decarboxylase
MKKTASVLCAWVLPLAAWAADAERDSLFQVSTLAALLDGHYEGETTLGALRGHGDFGIGTFEGLDGEMILLDGIFYQARADGKVLRPAADVKTPFACVTRFDADHRLTLAEGLDFEGLRKLLDDRFATSGMPFAIRVTGTFRQVKVRSVPAQTKPYPRLSEVVGQQPVFDYQNVEGTLVGFSLPPSLEGVNVPGYHLHLISQDATRGGHLLGFTLLAGAVAVDDTPEVRLRFSAAAAQAGMGTRKASRDEIERVEKESK